MSSSRQLWCCRCRFLCGTSCCRCCCRCLSYHFHSERICKYMSVTCVYPQACNLLLINATTFIRYINNKKFSSNLLRDILRLVIIRFVGNRLESEGTVSVIALKIKRRNSTLQETAELLPLPLLQLLHPPTLLLLLLLQLGVTPVLQLQLLPAVVMLPPLLLLVEVVPLALPLLPLPVNLEPITEITDRIPFDHMYSFHHHACCTLCSTGICSSHCRSCHCIADKLGKLQDLTTV